MKRWYKLVNSNGIDYELVNISTGETEAIIARYCGEGGWLRFLRGADGKWEAALANYHFTTLKAVRAFYDKVNH